MTTLIQKQSLRQSLSPQQVIQANILQLNISVLEKLCKFLKKGDIWVDTVENIGTYVNKKRSI